MSVFIAVCCIFFKKRVFILAPSSLSAFPHGKPQMVSPVLVMKSVVSTRSSLVPQSFSASVAPFGQCCVRAS